MMFSHIIGLFFFLQALGVDFVEKKSKKTPFSRLEKGVFLCINILFFATCFCAF